MAAASKVTSGLPGVRPTTPTKTPDSEADRTAVAVHQKSGQNLQVHSTADFTPILKAPHDIYDGVRQILSEATSKASSIAMMCTLPLQYEKALQPEIIDYCVDFFTKTQTTISPIIIHVLNLVKDGVSVKDIADNIREILPEYKKTLGQDNCPLSIPFNEVESKKMYPKAGQLSRFTAPSAPTTPTVQRLMPPESRHRRTPSSASSSPVTSHKTPSEKPADDGKELQRRLELRRTEASTSADAAATEPPKTGRIFPPQSVKSKFDLGQDLTQYVLQDNLPTPPFESKSDTMGYPEGARDLQKSLENTVILLLVAAGLPADHPGKNDAYARAIVSAMVDTFDNREVVALGEITVTVQEYCAKKTNPIYDKIMRSSLVGIIGKDVLETAFRNAKNMLRGKSTKAAPAATTVKIIPTQVNEILTKELKGMDDSDARNLEKDILDTQALAAK